MHVDLRRCGERPEYAERIWFFRWGFGVWLGTVLFTFGHDTRPRTASAP